MYIVNVIPITKSVSRDTLSYFSEKKTEIGSVVKISLRNKTPLGIVVSFEDLRNLKASIKKADFKMKKIDSSLSFKLFLPEFIEATRKASEYYISSHGMVFNSLVPATILQNPKEISQVEIKKQRQKNFFLKSSEISAIEDRPLERISRYKNIIREEFAKGFSVFICAPTINDIEYISNSVEKGLKEYIFIIHNYLSKKKIISTWNDICNKKHPVVIISTGKFLSIPRNDIKTIIIEKENSSFYKLEGRPFLDIRKFTEFFAKEIGANVILGDDVLRIETLWRHREGEIFEVGHIKTRYDDKIEVSIEDLSKDKEGGSFKIFGDSLDKEIKKLDYEKEKMFLFTLRKGLSPIVICVDCGTLVKCNNCEHPVVLYEKKNKRYLKCNLCGKERDVDKKCIICNSWKLNSLGVGIDLVEKEIKKKYKNIPVFKIDSSSVKTPKEASQIIKSFNDSNFGILLSTEMGLNYIKSEIQYSAIISLDSLFSVPNFYMGEKIFSIINQIRLFTKKKFIIQTRNPNNNLINLAASGNIGDFYRYEIENRKKFDYPPFVKFIKISISEKKQYIQRISEDIKKNLKKYNMSIYPSAYSKIKGSETINFLISIPNDKWVDMELLQKLRSFPQKFSIEVDPENIM